MRELPIASLHRCWRIPALHAEPLFEHLRENPPQHRHRAAGPQTQTHVQHARRRGRDEAGGRLDHGLGAVHGAIRSQARDWVSRLCDARGRLFQNGALAFGVRRSPVHRHDVHLLLRGAIVQRRALQLNGSPRTLGSGPLDGLQRCVRPPPNQKVLDQVRADTHLQQEAPMHVGL